MSRETNQMLGELGKGLAWAKEGAPKVSQPYSERIVPPEKVEKGEWPFTPEWLETVRASEIPATFPVQEGLFSQAIVYLHPEWIDEKSTREAVAAFARMLGIPENSDRETVTYALGLTKAISETKKALEADDPKTWTRVETSFKGRDHTTISYGPPTVGALASVRALDASERQEEKNRLTHKLGLGKFARGVVRENFGGNPVGLAKTERGVVAAQLQEAAQRRRVSRSADFFEEGLTAVTTTVESSSEQLGQRLEEWLPMARTMEEITIFYTFCEEYLTGEEPFAESLTEKFKARLLEIAKPFVEKPVFSEDLLAQHEQDARVRHARGEGDLPHLDYAKTVAQKDRALDDNP
jgi:hypothetical protein